MSSVVGKPETLVPFCPGQKIYKFANFTASGFQQQIEKSGQMDALCFPSFGYFSQSQILKLSSELLNTFGYHYSAEPNKTKFYECSKHGTEETKMMCQMFYMLKILTFYFKIILYFLRSLGVC